MSQFLLENYFVRPVAIKMDFRLNIANDVCRICLAKVNIQTSPCNSLESKDIFQKIASCFHIKVELEDHLPCKICNQCIEDFNNANSFKIKCLTINERFKTFCEDLSKEITTVNATYKDPVTDDDNVNNYNDKIEVKVETCLTDDEACKLNAKAEDSSTDKVKKFNSTVEFNSFLSEKFVCDKCNKVFSSKYSLTQHILIHETTVNKVSKQLGSDSTQRHQCDYCSYSATLKKTLVNHMRRHTGERPFKCHCGKSFTQSSTLIAHRKIHSDRTYYTCSQCGKQFKHAFALKNHYLVHSEGTFKCSICNKLLKYKKTLETHMKRHYRIYSYNCEDCGATFITSSELSDHRKKHTKESKVKCNFCDYTTNSRSNLESHLQRHTGDKQFRCNQCEKSFHTQTYLRRHMRVHTKEKKYSCEICNTKFTYSSSLNKHMLLVHKIKYRYGDVKLRVKSVV